MAVEAQSLAVETPLRSSQWVVQLYSLHEAETTMGRELWCKVILTQTNQAAMATSSHCQAGQWLFSY